MISPWRLQHPDGEEVDRIFASFDACVQIDVRFLHNGCDFPRVAFQPLKTDNGFNQNPGREP
jgi:hypothetical protein